MSSASAASNAAIASELPPLAHHASARSSTRSRAIAPARSGWRAARSTTYAANAASSGGNAGHRARADATTPATSSAATPAPPGRAATPAISCAMSSTHGSLLVRDVGRVELLRELADPLALRVDGELHVVRI